MWRKKKDIKKRRMLSGILAWLLVMTAALNSVGTISALAGEKTEGPRISYQYQKEQAVQITVVSENDSFAPGEEVSLKVYIQNNSDHLLTDGTLKWSGKDLEDAGFPETYLMEQEDFIEDEDQDFDEDQWSDDFTGTPSNASKGTPSNAETEFDGKKIKYIELAPGEVFETEFYGFVSEDLTSIKNRRIAFSFTAKQEDGGRVNAKEEFLYNTGMMGMLPVEFEQGNTLMTNEKNTMFIYTRFEEEKLLDELEEEYFEELEENEKGTPSNAERYEIPVATASDGTEEEGDSPRNIKYYIETYGVRLKGVTSWYDEGRSTLGDTVTGISFRVEDKTKPGIYFGKVITSIKRNGKSYKSAQGFYFYVLGDGEVVLTGKIGGAEIQVSGPRESFPEGDILSLKVTEVPEEKMDIVQDAMEQKAEEEGISVNKMRALDIKIIADGMEMEPEGEVTVRFSNVKLQEVDDLAAIAEHGQDSEMMSLEEEAATGNEAEEEANLTVWHLDEEAVELNDMGGEVDEKGDVVMTTDHFSIYIVVNVSGGMKEVPVTVEHWADVDVWNFMTKGDRTIPTETIVGKRLYPGTASGQTAYSTQEKKIYADDITTIPNGAGTGIGYEVAVSKWSKVALGGNYKVKSVTITNGKYPDGKTFTESSGGSFELTANNNNIKIVYEPTTGQMKGYADFHDYNVAIEGAGQSDVSRNKVGINNSSLPGETNDNRIYVGIGETFGFGHNRNGVPNTIGIQTNIPTDSLSNKQIVFNGYYDPGLFVTNNVITQEKWKGNTSVNYYAKKYLPNYRLDFKRKGDRYTLSAVYDEKGNLMGENYDNIRLSYHNINEKGEVKKLYSNLFWPLDNANYGTKGKDRDDLYGKKESVSNYKYRVLGVNDEQSGSENLGFPNVGHNWFFGMRYDVEFTLGDYVGDMDYYFRGDDDLWLYIDGKRVKEVDLGGIHSSEGAYVDIRDWMNKDGNKGLFYTTNAAGNLVLDKTKKHTMTVFFMERGGTGSCCYMSFMLPNAAPIPSLASETISKTVEKKWLDGNNADKRRPEFIMVQLQQDGVDYGNPVKLDASNNWRYTWNNLARYKQIGNNTEYAYTIKEISTPLGYSSSSTKKTNGFEITNTLIRDLTVEKVWNDGGNTDHTRPGSVQIQLYKSTNGGTTKTPEGSPVTLNAGNQWSYTWKNKPLYAENNAAISYSVEEVNTDWLRLANENSGWYTVSYSGNQNDGFVVTNTYTPEYTSAQATKVWSDGNNKYGLQADSVQVQLLKNGVVQTDKTTILNNDNNWSCTWQQLPKYTYTGSGGSVKQTLNNYDVKEITTYPNADYYKVAYSVGKGMNEIIITNTLKTARFRVAKRIDNYQDILTGTEKLDYDDLLKDEFIINVKEEGGRKFSTGMVLNHAANSDAGVVASGKASGYIEVPVTDEGVLFRISEIIPKEYTPSKAFLTLVNGQNAGLEGGDSIRVKPGADAIVVVHNIFGHEDYYHHDVSCNNSFIKGLNAEALKKLAQNALTPEPEPVDLFGLLEEAVTSEPPEERELGEDDEVR